ADEKPAGGLPFTVRLCGEKTETDCSDEARVAFNPDFYLGDRAMRESGFDISFRWGPFGGQTHHFAPVCLNSLLYKTEKDLEHIATLLGRNDDAAKWRAAAAKRQQLMTQLLWDAQRGMFFDYDFDRRQRSTYEFATTFHPLWAGAATQQQAAAVARNMAKFLHPGGLATSTRETGVQWDLPYGWAPLQLMPVEGLRRYGFHAEADRAARAFVDV